jgi:hypothetical protein
MTARTLAWSGVGLVAVLSAGCARSSAETAVTRAEAAIAAIRPEAEKVAPVELASLNDSLTAMKARIAAEDYSGALMGARSVNSLARDLGANLATRKAQLTTSYNTTAEAVPRQIGAVNARIAELAAMRRLPPGVDPAAFAAVRAEAPQWQEKWAEASQQFAAGNVALALTAANEVRARLTAVSKMLGMA